MQYHITTGDTIKRIDRLTTAVLDAVQVCIWLVFAFLSSKSPRKALLRLARARIRHLVNYLQLATLRGVRCELYHQGTVASQGRATLLTTTS